ncbi:HET-domain-containing protein [Cubamyces sp. BRFM 1775]|nr:HET-domain-containing protein [Cubamyces sp. BRFM 1775]
MGRLRAFLRSYLRPLDIYIRSSARLLFDLFLRTILRTTESSQDTVSCPHILSTDKPPQPLPSNPLPLSSALDTAKTPQPTEIPPDILSFDVTSDLDSFPPFGVQPVVKSAELPTRPDNVCARCWEGVFTGRLGLWSDPISKVWGRTGSTRWTGGFEYTISEAEWNTCRDSGCCWGAFIHETEALTRWHSKHSPPWHFRVGRPYVSKWDEMDIFMVVVNDDPDASSHERDYAVFAHIDDPASAWVKCRTRNPFTSRPDTLAMAKAAIEDCMKNHEDCKSFSALVGSSLPTRLIDCSDALRPRIVETQGWDAHVPYAALSYVWGPGDQPHRTTKAKLPLYLERIDLPLLPKTVLDAIHVTRTVLGLRYLWIDSLCIVQDSPGDKHRELAKMRDVYLHAFLTIDAGNAKSASQGFLHDGKPLGSKGLLPLICPRRVGEDGLEIGSVYIQFLGLSATSVHPSCAERDIAPYTSTMGRAWCLQEELMSRRRLLFTDLDLQFRCRAATQHPGGPLETYFYPYFRNVRLPVELIFRHRASSDVPPGSEDWADIHHAWQMLVEDYTRRRISYPSDRLIACAGIAELFGDGIRANYLAGLWEDSLLFDLLWYAGDQSNGEGGDSAAPSWSWAASGYGVNYSDGNRRRMRSAQSPDENGSPTEQLAEVVECAVALENPALRFGRVSGGCITLRAPLLGPYKKRPNELEPMDEPHHASGPQSDTDDSNEKTHFRCPHWNSGPYAPYVDRPCSEDEIRDLWVVPLLYRPSGYVECLLVQAAADDACVSCTSERRERVYTYRRVGYWNAWVVRQTSDEETNGFMDKLRAKVDRQWLFPRTELKLV